MLAWNGNADNMIDRFDGRALLDFYKDPDPRKKPEKTDEELELDEVTQPTPPLLTERLFHSCTQCTCCSQIFD